MADSEETKFLFVYISKTDRGNFFVDLVPVLLKILHDFSGIKKNLQFHDN
jgi:hypothetical protein